MRAHAFVAVLALAACKSGLHDGYAVNLTVNADSSVSDAAIASMTRLHLAVSNAETFMTDVNAAGKFSGRSSAIRYKPGAATTGTLHLALTGFAGTQEIAAGVVDVALKAGATQTATITLSATMPGNDMGGGDGGVPPQCSGTADGVCEAGCDANDDADCNPVCGNGAVERGETCDDGNTMNGDGCDPTCRYTNAFSVLSGHAGSSYAFADGIGAAARFDPTISPGCLATEGAYLYVCDCNTIRRVNPVTGEVRTIAGKVGETTRADGPGAMARMNDPQAITYDAATNKLFFIDNYDTVIRSIDLNSGTFDVATLPTNPPLAGPLGIDQEGGGGVVVLDGNGLTSYSITTGNGAVIATPAQLGVAGSYPAGVGGVMYAYGIQIGAYLVEMLNTVLKVVANGGGQPPTVTNFVGTKATSGCVDGVGTAASMKQPWGFFSTKPNGAGDIYVADPGCRTVSKITGGNAMTYAGLVNSYGSDDVPPAPDLLHMKFELPSAIVFINGVAYVLEWDGARIRKVTPSSTSVLAGSAAFVKSADTIIYGTASASRYNTLPQTSAIATDGKLVWAVLDTNDLIQVSLSDGSSKKLTTLPTGFAGMTRIGTTLYLAIAGNISTLDTAAGTGLAAYTTAGGITGGWLASDGVNKNLYWLDGTVVKKLDAAKTVTSLAGLPNTTTVQDGIGAGASFSKIVQALACDGTKLYTLDSATGVGRLVVRSINLGTAEVKTIVGKVATAGTTDGIGTNARLAGAWTLATDGTNLFIADGGNGASSTGDTNGPTIRQMVIATGSVTTMVGKRGQWSAVAGTGVGAVIDWPTAIVADAPSHTVVLFDNSEGVFEVIR